VTRRLTLEWPDPRPFQYREWEPIRLLAASDERDPALDFQGNREALGRLDLVIGCGDLPAETLAFLGDAFTAPLLYVRGNHDRGGAWRAAEQIPVEAAGVDEGSLPGLGLLGLRWPGPASGRARRDDTAAWWQVLRTLKVGLLRPGDQPWIVYSHAPPRGAGDTPEDPYHVGFGAYRTVLDRLRPRLWLHGHTSRAAAANPIVEHGPTTLVNVTGSVLIELRPVF
jgi:Icc-related predicted phosphoesterase